MPRVAVTTENHANQAARHHLMHGADGIVFELPDKSFQLPALLENIEWPYCTISFFATVQPTLPQTLLQYCHSKSYNSKQLEGAIFWKIPTDVQPDVLKGFQPFEKFRPLGIFTATSSPVQEISQCLVQGQKYFENYLALGADKETIAQAIAFSVPVASDFLTAIAKLKALRLLWYQIAKAYQCETFEPHHLHLHVRSEIFTQEALQPHSNLLKSTTASVAAICGGCNALTVYEEHPENTLMQRMARNTSLLLREESHFNKVADPTAGAYAIDAIVHALAREAWQHFQSQLTNPATA